MATGLNCVNWGSINYDPQLQIAYFLAQEPILNNLL
jgi:hypothetical protein